jgi:hypothetical protein
MVREAFYWRRNMNNHPNLSHSQVRARQFRGEAEAWQIAHSAAGNRADTSQPRALSIRMAVPEDGSALRRLAQLDGRRPLEVSLLLVAEVDGEVLAALPLDGGEAIADPFRRTATLVAMLKMRAGQRSADQPRVGLRARFSRLLRAPAERTAIPVTQSSMLVSRDGC